MKRWPGIRQWSLALLLGAGALEGRLAFDATVLQHTADFDETAYTGIFTFRNAGTEAVEIREVRSSCGCTIPRLAQTNYAPGETGQIEAIFTFGSRTDRQTKSIEVVTDPQNYELILDVTIPRRWESDQRILIWSEEAALVPQAVTIDFFHGVPLNVRQVEVDPTAYAATSQWNEAGNRLTVQFTPLHASQTGIYRAEIRLRDAFDGDVVVPVFLRFR